MHHDKRLVKKASAFGTKDTFFYNVSPLGIQQAHLVHSAMDWVPLCVSCSMVEWRQRPCASPPHCNSCSMQNKEAHGHDRGICHIIHTYTHTLSKLGRLAGCSLSSLSPLPPFLAQSSINTPHHTTWQASIVLKPQPVRLFAPGCLCVASLRLPAATSQTRQLSKNVSGTAPAPGSAGCQPGAACYI